MCDLPILKKYNLEINEEQYLWKFLTIEKFLSIIINKSLHFNRLDLFEDLNEGVSTDLLLLNIKKESLLSFPPFKNLIEYHQVDFFPSETDELIDNFIDIQKTNYANCWYLSEKNVESVAMWNLYSSYNSVAIKIKLRNFYDNFMKYSYFSIPIKTLTIGRVEYINFQNPDEILKVKENIKNSAFIKDISFKHENEIRIIAEIEKLTEYPLIIKEGISKHYQKKLHNSTSQLFGFTIKLNDFSKYDFEIVFNPKMPDWIKNDIIDILNNYEPSFNTINSKINLK